jgi:xanthine dehydrogenase YagS FAD-binding subunit
MNRISIILIYRSTPAASEMTATISRANLGGVAALPWRAREAEAHLKGKELNDESKSAAADAAFASAEPHGHNGFKIELGKRALVRALSQVATLEI